MSDGVELRKWRRNYLSELFDIPSDAFRIIPSNTCTRIVNVLKKQETRDFLRDRDYEVRWWRTLHHLGDRSIHLLCKAVGVPFQDNSRLVIKLDEQARVLSGGEIIKGVSNYRGPARQFSEGDEDFQLMLQRGVDFMNYLILWSGGGADKYIPKDQQERLGVARTMAIALEKNP